MTKAVKSAKSKKSSRINSFKNLVTRFDTPRHNFYLVAVAVIILAGFFIALNPPKKDTTVDNTAVTGTTATSFINEAAKPKNIAYKGQNGKTAFEILKENFPYTASGEGANTFVTGINDYTPDTKKEFWAFYVNGQQAQVGANNYQTKDTDLIEWRLEAITE